MASLCVNREWDGSFGKGGAVRPWGRRASLFRIGGDSRCGGGKLSGAPMDRCAAVLCFKLAGEQGNAEAASSSGLAVLMLMEKAAAGYCFKLFIDQE
jgi:hypothetical protein